MPTSGVVANADIRGGCQCLHQGWLPRPKSGVVADIRGSAIPLPAHLCRQAKNLRSFCTANAFTFWGK